MSKSPPIAARLRPRKNNNNETQGVGSTEQSVRTDRVSASAEEGKCQLSFEQQMKILELQRKIKQEEKEARKLEYEFEREKLESQREAEKLKYEAEERAAQLKLIVEKERRETEMQLEKERMEAERERRKYEREIAIEEEERLRLLRKEKEEFDIRSRERQKCVPQTESGETKVRPQYMKIREMRESEDIDDYFRIFEMTARAQFLPEKDWIGNLIPRLTEKAKSAYLEIPEPISQDYEQSKSIIIKAYQLTVDHYRYRFRTSEKRPDEDFVQWINRTRRYLNRWMSVAEADSRDKVLEQIMIEKMLDSVGPELKSWLKEQQPRTAEELGNLANRHVQARKGPMIGGKYMGNVNKYNKPEDRKRTNPTDPKTSHTAANVESPKPPQSSPPITTAPPSQPQLQRRQARQVNCYKCGKEGHMSFNCRGGKPSSGYFLCTSTNSEGFRSNIRGKINGQNAEMVVDTGCTTTLIHRKYVNDMMLTGDYITVLTATGERVSVPLARVCIDTFRGKNHEVVGVSDKLPVDCLLGRSSFGKTLTKQDIIEQWTMNKPRDGIDRPGDTALVLTRRQKALELAQKKADEFIDQQNKLSINSLAKAPVVRDNRDSMNVDECDLPILFQDEERKSEQKPTGTADKQGESGTTDDVPVNILDRNATQLITDQQMDITLDKARAQASSSVPEKEGYYLDRGILMHRKLMSDLPDSVRYADRIVVPEAYRSEILRVAHTIPLAGHMGIKKTLDRITTHFAWPGVSADVKNYCATCPQCQLVARKMKSDRAPLRPTEIICEPFKKIAIDIVGELPKSSNGYKYILTIVDYATRYPEAIPLRSINSKVIADALIQFFSRVGIPEELVSDQGTNFISTIMTQLYESLGIRKIKTSVYHPEGNGLVERFNGTLKAMLKKFVGDNVKAWDKYLPYLLFAYREVPTESIGFSPFELMYGRTIRGPLAVIKETWLEKDPNRHNLTTYVLEMRRRLATMQEVVQKSLKKNQSKQKQLYDTYSSKRKFQVGDKVLVLLPTPGSKLEVKWQGPYTIMKVLNNGLNYEIDTGKTRKQHRIYHINLLNKWQSRDELTALVMPESQEITLPHESNVPSINSDESFQDVAISENLDESQRQQVKKLLLDYSEVFSGIPNRTTAAEHHVNTEGAVPVRSSPYKVPQKLEDEVNKEIERMLDMGIVRQSSSPWASPIVVVPKPDGSIRFCADYRKLNKVTKMDAYPIPSMERMIEKVARAKYISTLDLTKGYWQIPLEESTIEKSAFITSNHFLEFLVMPFGMKTAPATFQRMMSEVVLKGLDFANAYIDDVEIDSSDSFSQHLIQLRQVLERLRFYKLNARPTKCKIAMRTVDFVGHKVGGDQIKPRDALVQAINKFPRPETKQKMRSFLGLVNYYRKFIPHFSERASVLTDLTKAKLPNKISWSEQHEVAFRDLKNALTGPPVLRPPHWDEPFIVQVDASNRALGAILCQRDQNDDEHPIVYASRKLQPREEKLSTTEKECLAIVWAVELFRYYLYGRKFLLQTDHNPLVWLNQVRDKSQKLLRWSITLQEYDMDIQHKSGKECVNVDALSRMG